MTDRSKLLALADAVEKLSGPDREVDAEIALSSGLVGDNTVAHASGWCVGGRDQPQLSSAYTASLDAAMTLVPERYARDVMLSISPMSVDMGGKDWKAALGGMKNRSSARSFALALTAAALRAQAAMA